MDYKFADRMSRLKASEIREILKITQNPEMISFAGGLPAPELFPIAAIKKACIEVLDTKGSEALQYTTTEGYDPLRSWIAQRMNSRLQTSFTKDNILITHGSQQALDLTGKVFLDEGDVVLCESPTYLAAISAFRAYGCDFAEVPTDDQGMKIEALEQILATTPKAKLIYVIPDFQNPTGRTWSLSRRQKLAQLANRYGVMVLEDNPYGELRFEGEFLPSVKAFDQVGSVMCTGTFSKIFCPGFRLGWIAAPEEVLSKYILAKQGTDLQCNTLAQMELAKYLEQNNIDEHIDSIREVYRERRDLALAIMSELFPESVGFTRPEGGLFAWVELPEGVDAKAVLAASLRVNVAFVPGGSFFPNGGHENTFRINFSNMPKERIQLGLERLAGVLREFYS